MSQCYVFRVSIPAVDDSQEEAFLKALPFKAIHVTFDGTNSSYDVAWSNVPGERIKRYAKVFFGSFAKVTQITPLVDPGSQLPWVDEKRMGVNVPEDINEQLKIMQKFEKIREKLYTKQVAFPIIHIEPGKVKISREENLHFTVKEYNDGIVITWE